MTGVRNIYTLISAFLIFLGAPLTTWAKPQYRPQEPQYAPCTSDTVSKEQQEATIANHRAKLSVQKKLQNMSVPELGQLLESIDATNPAMQPLVQEVRTQLLKKIAQNPVPVRQGVPAQQEEQPAVAHVAENQDLNRSQQQPEQPGFFGTAFSTVKSVVTAHATYRYVIQPVWEKIFGSPLTKPAALAQGATAKEAAAHTAQVAAYTSALQDQETARKVAEKTGLNNLPFLQEKTAQVVLSSSKFLAFLAASTALHKISSAVGFTGWCQKMIYGDDFEKVAQYEQACEKFVQDFRAFKDERARGNMSAVKPVAPEMPSKKLIFKTQMLPQLLPVATMIAEYALLMPYIEKPLLALLT